jgi:hypothetical protein
MDSKRYFEEVSQKINNMSDEEFDQLLLESGLEKCPYEEDLKDDPLLGIINGLLISIPIWIVVGLIVWWATSVVG